MRPPTIKSDVCNFLKYTPMLFNGGKQTDASDKRKHIHIMSSTTIACFPLYNLKVHSRSEYQISDRRIKYDLVF